MDVSIFLTFICEQPTHSGLGYVMSALRFGSILDRPICLTTREETIGAVLQEAETVTCVVEASPDPLQFSWTFADSRTVYTSPKVNLFITNH